MNLDPELQKLIDERVKSGKYASAEDVIAAALLTLDQQETFGDFATGELDELLAEGERSITEQGCLDGDEALAFGVNGALARLIHELSDLSRANADIEAICDYIARDNPDAANRLDDRIHETIKLLAQFPGMGHSRTDVKDKRYLFWTVGSYVIAYRIENKVLLVVRLLHGARDFRAIFRGGARE